MELKQMLLAMAFIFIMLTTISTMFERLDVRYISNPNNTVYGNITSFANATPRQQMDLFIKYPADITAKTKVMQENFENAVVDPNQDIYNRLSNLFMGAWNGATIFFDTIMATVTFASDLFSVTSLAIFGVGWIGTSVGIILGIIVAVKVANVALKRGGMG